MRVTRKVLAHKVVETHDEIADVLCDICGESTMIDGIDHYQYASLGAYWGYGSPYDGEEHSLDICVKCYDQLPDYLKSKIRVWDHMGEDSRVGLAFR